MKLLHSPNSPFARKCRIVAIEKGLLSQIEVVASLPADNEPQLWAANPLGRVPALILDNGKVLCESPVICEYLDSLSEQNPLFPADKEARFASLSLAALASGIMDSAVAIVLENRRPEAFRYAPWLERKERAVVQAIDVLAKEGLSADQFTIGEISALVALDYVRFRMPHIEWQQKHPKLVQWLGTVYKRQSVIETAPQA
jgi:glutathione S-transferase